MAQLAIVLAGRRERIGGVMDDVLRHFDKRREQFAPRGRGHARDFELQLHRLRHGGHDVLGEVAHVVEDDLVLARQLEEGAVFFGNHGGGHAGLP
ncbi:hypothetical protein D3C71_1634050 [compost metagenome]